MKGNVNINRKLIINLAIPTNAQDATTKTYVDTAVARYFPIAGGSITGNVNMNTKLINYLADPLSNTGVANKSYVDTAVTSYLPLAGETMTGNLNMHSKLINNLANPTSAQDAATKNYVDSNAFNTTIGNSYHLRLDGTNTLTKKYLFIDLH